MIQADASGLEWRTAIELSQDPIGLQEILNLEDTHSKNQAALFLPDRLTAKRFLFRTIFRGSGFSFANDPDFMHVSSSAKYWDKANAAFYKKYKGLDNTHKEWAQLVVQGQPLTGPLGHFWPISMTTDYKGQLKIPWTVLTNYPVQGTGAGLMMIARISFFNRLKTKSWASLCKLVSSVHDSIVVDAPSYLLNEISMLFHDVFKDLPSNVKKLFGYTWKVPLACEVKYGPNMKDMVKHEF